MPYKIGQLAGEPARDMRTKAPGTGQPFGGFKVSAEKGFMARPSSTEDILKIDTKSFRSKGHLRPIQQQVRATIGRLFEPIAVP